VKWASSNFQLALTITLVLSKIAMLESHPMMLLTQR
jgi:hypothetical protein